MMRGSNPNAHALSLHMRHCHYWARLLELWRSDSVISNLEIKLELGTANVREPFLSQKEPCVIKPQGVLEVDEE